MTITEFQVQLLRREKKQHSARSEFPMQHLREKPLALITLTAKVDATKMRRQTLMPVVSLSFGRAAPIEAWTRLVPHAVGLVRGTGAWWLCLMTEIPEKDKFRTALESQLLKCSAPMWTWPGTADVMEKYTCTAWSF